METTAIDPVPAVLAELCDTCSLLEDIHALSGPTSTPSILQYYLNTSFNVQDTWPGLPKLALSAASGCHSCKLLHASLSAASDLQPWLPQGRSDVSVVFSAIPAVYEGFLRPGALGIATTDRELRTVFGFVARLFGSGLGLVREAKFLACVEVSETSQFTGSERKITDTSLKA